MFQASENDIFRFCVNLDEVEIVFYESKEKLSKFFKLKIGHQSILENGFKATLRSKKMFWALENGVFHFFENF